MYVYVCEYVHVGVCDLSQRGNMLWPDPE
jgi:hypothetical protein